VQYGVGLALQRHRPLPYATEDRSHKAGPLASIRRAGRLGGTAPGSDARLDANASPRAAVMR
jgi:hypothetical protein